MAKSQETYNKKEKEKKRIKKRQDKEQKKEERKANAVKATSLEEMFAYVDENGNLTTTPPDPKLRNTIRKEDIQLGVPKLPPSEKLKSGRTGVVSFFNDSKGYGFIEEQSTRERFFVHINSCSDPLKEGNRVSFETEKGNRGLCAVRVVLLK